MINIKSISVYQVDLREIPVLWGGLQVSSKFSEVYGIWKGRFQPIQENIWSTIINGYGKIILFLFRILKAHL